MKILIVGGAGYVGGTATDLLLRMSHTIRVYDALLYEAAYQKPVEFIRGDVRDTEKLAPHLDWADAVIWLAAVVGDGACALYPDVAREVNEDAVTWLAKEYDGRIIFPSTSMVYGAQGGELTEQTPLAPVSLYAKTKAVAEQALAQSNAIIFRFGTLFGAGDKYTRPRFDLVAHLFLRLAMTGKPMTVRGGTQMRALLHVCDAARMLVAACETSHTGTFNLHGQNVSVGEIAKTVKSIIPEATITLEPAEVVVSGNYSLSSAKARAQLGFSPSMTLEEGLRELEERLLARHLNTLYDSRYSNEAFVKEHPLHLWKK